MLDLLLYNLEQNNYYATVDYQEIPLEIPYNYEQTTTLCMSISLEITSIYILGSPSKSAKRLL